MSRCFRFPPPGYEKKPATNEPDLLKKEQRKEKKHKKDKKDKEKKDRSEGKHKEKKEKHRDRKKDKDKIKNSPPDEKKILAQFEGYNGETSHYNNEQNKNGKYYEQIQKKEDIIKDKSIPFRRQNGVFIQNGIKVGETEDFKFVQDLGRRIRDEEKGMCRKNSDVAGFGGNVSKINGVTPPPPLPPPVLPPPLPPPPRLDNKIDSRIDRMQEKLSDDKHGDKRKHKDRDKDREKEKSEKSKEKSERKKAEKEMKKHMKKIYPVSNLNNLSIHPLENGFHEGNLKKRKDMETNGVFHENELRPNKMARPISTLPPENGRKLDYLQNRTPNFSNKQAASLTNGGQKVNGTIPFQPALLPIKKQPIPGFNHVPSKPSPIKSPPLPPPPPPAKPPESRPKPPPQPPVPIPKKKPPHPDAKYLNQILTVPKLDPWCDYDDQEWLFSSKPGRPRSEKPTAENVEVQVWSEAKHIQSVDIYALPYVIPY